MNEQATAANTATNAAQRVKWAIDPAHSEVQFKVKHMMISTITGSFTQFEADIDVAGDDLATAQVEFRANVASISTHNSQRDAHLQGSDFFGGEAHPQVVFKLKRAEPVDRDGSWTLYGDLSMNGTTKEVKLDAEWGGVLKDPFGNTKAGVSIHGKISRKDWGLNWNAALETGGVMVSDEVRIACEVQLVKQG